MASRWWSVVVDSSDPQKLGRWWAEVLGYTVIYDSPDEVVVVDGGAQHPRFPCLVFVRVPQAGTRENRLHLDLNPDDLEAEVARLQALGARRAETGCEVPGTVLADPEGNEFCVLTARPQE